MDGAALKEEILYVLTPMAVPGIASTILLNIILAWNEAFWTLNLPAAKAAPAAELYGLPHHPYTLGLLKSVPRLDQIRKAKLEPIDGFPPDLIHMPEGCSFRPRCKFAVDRCQQEEPPLLPVADKHYSACWEWQKAGQAAKPAASA